MIRLSIAVVLCSFALRAQPVVGGVTNGASFDATLSPGSIGSVFGTRLALSNDAASSLPLPRTLSGTVVRVGNVQAPLYFVSAGQINFQVPFETAAGTAALTVTTSEGTSSVRNIVVSAVAPAIFALGTDAAKALYFNGQFQIAPAVVPGDAIVFYANGLGQTAPATATGAGGSTSEPLNRLNPPPDLFIGGNKANVLFAGMAPGLAGVYQVNATVPDLETDSIEIRTGGRSSKLLKVNVAGGSNATDVSGDIEILYPKTTTKVSFSPIPVVFRYTIRLTARTAARPFSAAIQVEGVGARGRFDFLQQSGSYTATVPVPTSAARNWSFSGTEISIVDYLAVALGFGDGATPGNIMPISRIDRDAQAAISLVPLPNVPAAGSSTGSHISTGAIQPGTPLVITGDANISAVYLQRPYSAANKQATVRVTLYIEGKPVATREVTFQTE